MILSNLLQCLSEFIVSNFVQPVRSISLKSNIFSIPSIEVSLTQLLKSKDQNKLQIIMDVITRLRKHILKLSPFDGLQILLKMFRLPASLLHDYFYYIGQL
jgi:hypothetical protein